MSRSNKYVFKVFCEGDTEYNYYDLFNKKNKLNLALRPYNMDGGGYAGFLREIKKDGSLNSIAKFIIIDGDRAFAEEGEKKKLIELIEYCIQKNDSGKIPYILIINYPDFEYLACLHSSRYKNQDSKQFILSEYNYKSLDDYKADKKVFDKLNSRGNSYQNMLNKVSDQFSVITNTIDIKKSKFFVKVKTERQLDNFGKKGSNIKDLFYVLREFGELV